MDSVEVLEVIRHARGKGASLWVAEGQLHYRAPAGALSREELQGLSAAKQEIVEVLERDTGGILPYGELARETRAESAPLTLSQLWHWHMFGLGERPSASTVSHATHLYGPIDVERLRWAMEEIVRRHDALRIELVPAGPVPIQRFQKFGRLKFTLDDLTRLPRSSHEEEVTRRIERFLGRPTDVYFDPLLRISLLKLRNDEHVLIIAMDHLISDAWSIDLFLREAFMTYAPAGDSGTVLLPPVPMQYSDYAIWQHKSHDSRLEKQGQYWKERLEAHRLRRFPVSSLSVDTTQLGWSGVPVRVSKEMTSDLREWSRARRTTLAMSVFTAYAALVLKWCGTSDALVQYQTNGRISPKVEGTIGYFASLLGVRITAGEDFDLLKLLYRVIEEYCSAADRGDLSYMTAQMARNELVRTTIFNWVPRVPSVDIATLGPSGKGLTASPIAFANPALSNVSWNNDPEIILFDAQEEIVGALYFPTHRFRNAEMERFAQNFLMLLDVLLRRPEQLLKTLELV